MAARAEVEAAKREAAEAVQAAAVAQAVRDAEQVARRQNELLHQLKGSVDTVIRDAVLARATERKQPGGGGE